MADDGMFLNFEIGDAPIKQTVKYTGGRWRDRVKAQKGEKGGQDQTKEASTGRRDDYYANRGAKRQRTEDGDSGRFSKTPRTGNPAPRGPAPPPTHAIKTGLVSSRLFTSNPVPVTDFEEAEVEEAEPAQPSNAPLTAEAENFLSLGLSRRVSQHLATKLEMKAPTAIQKNTIPQLIKEDTDAFLQAETGSGKTLAYLLPIVHRILALSHNEDGTPKATKVHRNSGLFAIILAPTRELCKQIAVVLEKVLRCAPWLVCTTVIGGESKKSEKARIRKGVNILIATPGRLTDHLDNTKVLEVGTVRWLVLDEGDRMMEMGFEDDIRTIVGKIRAGTLQKKNAEGVVLDGVLPSRRVTVLCSATMKMNVQKLGEISLEDAVHITASKSDMEKDAETGAVETAFSAPAQLKQAAIITPAKLRLVTLIALLKSTFARKGSVMKAIIFISCADSVDYHFELLKSTAAPRAEPEPKPEGEAPTKPNIHIESTVGPATYITSPANPTVMLHKLHGSLAQPVRTATLKAFSECKDPAVLITTDISSRGLDVPAVELVIEYDPAFAVPDHMHRIGRTARAGRAGKAVLFLLPGSEEGYISILPKSTPIAPQLYDSVLQKGFATTINVPGTESGVLETDRQSWASRAEALQLHFEQRLLAPLPGATPVFESKSEKFAASKQGKKGKKDAKKDAENKTPENPLLVSARQAFRSHIRAYATHVREERVYFDMTALHLGHMAKAFGLREAPGGIGGGVSRRTHRPVQPGDKTNKTSRNVGDGSSTVRKPRNEDDDRDFGAADEDAGRRMKEKMKMMMGNMASEFNLG
ncbi:P-loop containing nucleoside triphosphate hydrolase protein [Pseudoneurospora amorphoporcata]|uniref:ATP-dependent RNA helicase n=1 Tax=Pseudoneurospora amorphoporcata TaxID=241081 RepID=A0AAN6P6X5_9PEZI|nr:P-loop containing nucleoside triphosphate hydrolase protein [Pseudoneurospora amorphoporcata]